MVPDEKLNCFYFWGAIFFKTKQVIFHPGPVEPPSRWWLPVRYSAEKAHFRRIFPSRICFSFGHQIYFALSLYLVEPQMAFLYLRERYNKNMIMVDGYAAGWKIWYWLIEGFSSIFIFLKMSKNVIYRCLRFFWKKFLWLQFLNYLKIKISDLQKIYHQSGKRKLNDFSFVNF